MPNDDNKVQDLNQVRVAREGSSSSDLKLAPGEELWPETITARGHVYSTDELAGALEALATWSHAVTESKGFYDFGEDYSESTLLLMIHDELSEANEARRIGNPESKKIPGNSCVAEELADALLRILCFGKQHGHDVVAAVISKGFYNEKRPYKHGGKKF